MASATGVAAYWSRVAVGGGLAELYAGSRSREGAVVLDRITTTMNRIERLLVPEAADWARAGQLPARRVHVEGALHPTIT